MPSEMGRRGVQHPHAQSTHIDGSRTGVTGLWGSPSPKAAIARADSRARSSVFYSGDPSNVHSPSPTVNRAQMTRCAYTGAEARMDQRWCVEMTRSMRRSGTSQMTATVA